jgi:hypothetical protein
MLNNMKHFINKLRKQERLGQTISTFVRFNLGTDVVATNEETVTAGVWSENISSLDTHFTSSVATNAQRQYYIDVYQDDPANEGSAVQYSLAYGHAFGSGSNSTGQLNDSPSRAIYAQYRSLLLNRGDSRFTTPSGSTNSIYIINFKRNRLKERLDPGNFEIPLSAISARSTNATGSVTTDSSNIITLIDNSSLTSATVGEAGKVYYIVSGSINNGVYNSTSPVYYGLAYPDHGVLILDANKLDQSLAFKTNVSSSSEANNHFALYKSISGSGAVTNPSTSDPYGFLARNSETVKSMHYFVRVTNGQFNYSNNPTYVTGSEGLISQPSFRKDPKTYITTIGLYNDQQELLAVAKLSKPLLKSKTREALIRVKLDF